MDLGDIVKGSPPPAVVHKPKPHDSAAKHMTGEAVYVDDIRTPAGTLHAAPGYAPIAAGRVTKLDLDAVRKAPGVVVLNDSLAGDEKQLHKAWRSWLSLMNAMQVLPGVLMTTVGGLAAHDYDTFDLDANAGQSAASGAGSALAGAWDAVLEQTLDELRPGLRRLALSGAAVPVVGYELADAKGTVVADSEFAWADSRFVVLRSDQDDLRSVWTEAGWGALVLDEALATAGGAPWEVLVAETLELTLVGEGQE